MDVSELTKERIKQFLDEDKRFDERKPLEFRSIIIETGISKNAEGSARVKLGNTEVIAGVKIDVTEPYPDHEDEGTLITICELLPLSSRRFEPGPPGIEAVEMARIIDRGIRESGFIDFKKLCIKEGEKVYSILLDIYSINDDGNLIDAGNLASIIALKLAKLPKYNEKTERIEYGNLTDKPLPLTEKMPITMTFHKIGNKILIDPVAEEEHSSEGRISISLSRDDKKGIIINAVQKGEEKTFSVEEVLKIIGLAEKIFLEIEGKIVKVK